MWRARLSVAAAARLPLVVPGFYYRLGQVKPGTTTGDHHTPTFRADDSSVPVGIRVLSFLVADYLERHK